MSTLPTFAKWMMQAVLPIAMAQIPTHASESPAAPQSLYATVNGVKLHYLREGSGPVVILLHGYAETSHMWPPLIPALARTHTVIAPDLRGSGESDMPETGYDKKSMAQDIHALAVSLGIHHAKIVGHDIGLMVAYAYASQYPRGLLEPNAITWLCRVGMSCINGKHDYGPPWSFARIGH
jgi:pimeloyl-ACP methyl ester carboxylesterase